MNVPLICPKFPDTFGSFSYAVRFIRKKAELTLPDVKTIHPAELQVMVGIIVGFDSDSPVGKVCPTFISPMNCGSAREVSCG